MNRKTSTPKRGTNVALLPALKREGARLALKRNISFSRLVSDLLTKELEASK